MIILGAILGIAAGSSAWQTAPNEQQLDRYQRIIENTDDSDTTRTLQARELVMLGTTESADLVAVLLRSTQPGAARIVSRAIATAGRENPAILSESWVEPLLALLASPRDGEAVAAGEALAEYRDPKVFSELSNIVSNKALSLEQRKAALVALEANVDQRPVLRELIRHLDSDEAELVNHIVEILQRVSGRNTGPNVQAWRAWWSEQEQKSDQEFLEDIARHFARELRLARMEADAARQQWQTQRRRLLQQLSVALASNYRLTAPQEQEELLINWLSDARPEYRVAATRLVAERISEGLLPSGDLRLALTERFADPDADIRKSAVETIAALNNPDDATMVLARLKLERSEEVRHALLRALGKLRNPAAIGPLIAILGDGDASSGSVAAAADALAMLASRDAIPDAQRTELIGPLKSRFASLGPGDRQTRIAVLEAMAAVGDPAFRSEFEANLGADDPELLLRAIQGAAVVGDKELLGRLLGLLVHADARVRQRAIESVGKLGDETHLDSIAARLDPDVEPLEEPRDAAWRAFNTITRRLSPDAQLVAADRLTKRPNLRVEYLAGLYQTLVNTNANAPILGLVRERLAVAYGLVDRACEAMPLWKLLHDTSVRNKDARRFEFASELLESAVGCRRGEFIAAALGTLVQADASRREAAENLVIGALNQADADPLFVADMAQKLDAMDKEAFPRLDKAIQGARDAVRSLGNENHSD